MRGLKFFGLGAALVLLALVAVSSSAVTVGAGLQPPPGKGTVYVTKVAPAPDGAILKVMDLALGITNPIISGLNLPFDVLCGPDGRFYVTEVWAREGIRTISRIVRFNQDGSGRTVLAQWPSSELRPIGLVFAPNGDLYFGTTSIAEGRRHKGIWRIRGALQADQQFNPPEQVLPLESFTRTPSRYDSVTPQVFLSSGPFQGDLLLADSPSFTGDPGGHVLRAPKPEFNTVVEFIPQHDNPNPFQPKGLAVNSQGDVFVSDTANDKVLRYGSDGTLKGTFAEIVGSMQIAIGPDDIVYLTAWRSDSAAALFVLGPDGKVLGSSELAFRMYEVTVCAPQ